ncbi:MAG: methyltransferase MtaB domain-containing protein [candidate division WOR-3 bacterium]
MKKYNSLAYKKAQDIWFGRSLHPLVCGFGLRIGDGKVFPEINYTLPPMSVSMNNIEEIEKQYDFMVKGILKRAVTLQVPGIVLEFEHLPPMTDILEIGVRITKKTKEIMKDFYDKYGLNSALRVTICDTREEERPPKMRSGQAIKRIFSSFLENAYSGGDLLSIESIGGKEVNDRALMEGNVAGILFSLGVLAPRDMHFLWKEINEIAKETNTVPAGDSACGLANTAMMLADRGYIPEVLAATIRAMSSVRSLIAFEEGAVGPSKDCAYEGPIIKAITGYPISMEGKSSACAHLSHLGNIAGAVCDLWSNESIQNIKLLADYAPIVFTEILAYDCRVMNTAIENDQDKVLQELLIKSDELKNVQAFIISPENSFEIAKVIVEEKDDFLRTRLAGLKACELIKEAVKDRKLTLSDRELNWLNKIEAEIAKYEREEILIKEMSSLYGEFFLLDEYGIGF